MTHSLLKLGYTSCSFEYIYSSRDEVSENTSVDTRTAWIDKIMAVYPDELKQKIMDEISGRKVLKKRGILNEG